jgi:hypothetical protein
MLKITTMNCTEIHELSCIVVDTEIADGRITWDCAAENNACRMDILM